MSTNTSMKTSATAVSVSRWGQFTSTSVRRQRELENNGNNNNNATNIDIKRAKTTSSVVDKLDILREKTISTDFAVTTIPPKPKVNKFFKSRGSAQQNDMAREKMLVRDKEDNRLLSNSSSNANISNNSSNNNNEKEIQSKTKSSSWKQQFNETKLTERKSQEINYSKAKPNVILSEKLADKRQHETNGKRGVSRNSGTNNGATKRNQSQNEAPSMTTRVTRSSRRLQGVEPEATARTEVVVQQLHTYTVHTSEKLLRLEEHNKSVTPRVDLFAANNYQTMKEEVFEDEEDDDDDECDIKDEVEYNDCDITDIYESSPPVVHNKLETCADLSDTVMIDDNSIHSDDHESVPQLAEQNSNNNNDNDIVLDEPLSHSQPNPEPIIIDSEVIPESVSASVSQPSEPTQPIVAIKPKKKFFSSSNKAKNRAVFNTKNIWSSGTADEFTGEPNSDSVQTSQPSSSSLSSDNKKVGNELDFDDESEYVVLRRIKKAHQCHDLGETSQFDDDIKFYLSGIESTNTVSMRCLSILGLSQQAMRPEFRMHLRAHDDMPRIIRALMDAISDANLSLCTATLMFVYSQDRLTMDIDPNALSLMLQLLETQSDECNQVDAKHRDKVKALCEEMKSKGHAKYLNLNEITAGKLTMETFLGLTSKRAGEWFKEELRHLKGIDFIMDTVLRCSDATDEGSIIKIDRCMHVLENVTFNNIENQLYILQYKDGSLITICIKLLHICKHQIILINDSKVFLSAFFSILRVLTHLTSESSDGCFIIGSYDGIIDLLLESVYEVPSFISSDQRFDLMVILLCLCINLVEFCPAVRNLVISSSSKLERLIELLYRRIDDAQQTEQQTDELLESHESVQMTEWTMDSLLKQMLAKSGKHMEHSIIAACVSLLLGCTIQDNLEYTNTVREYLPNQTFDPLVEVLQKLRDFAYLADIMTKKGKERVDRIIQVFKSF